jgi:hypothetical protein
MQLGIVKLFINLFIAPFSDSSRETLKRGMSLDLMMELEKLKTYLNNVELQLYEANEHISDLLEKVKTQSIDLIAKLLSSFFLVI